MDAAEKISTTGKNIASTFKGADLAAGDSLIPPFKSVQGPSIYSVIFVAERQFFAKMEKHFHRTRLGSHLLISRRSDLLLAA